MKHSILFVYQKSQISLKINIYVQVSFYSVKHWWNNIPHPTFNSDTAIVLQTTPLTHIFKVLYDNLIHQIDSFEQNGSGWVVQNLVYLDLYVAQYDLLGAFSYLKMPNKFQRGYTNIKNKDNKCFCGACWLTLFL